MDYERPGTWDELARALELRFTPVPCGVFGHVTCEPGWSWRFHHHDYDMWLVSGGRGSIVIDGQPIAVSAGSLVIIRAGDRGYGEQDYRDRLTVTFTHFSFVRPGTTEPVDVPPEWLPSRHIRLKDPPAVQEPLLNVVRLREQNDGFASLQARIWLSQALAEAYRQDAAAKGQGPRLIDPRVVEVMRYVRSRPSERPTLKQAADVARVSPSHLRRLFASELGTSYRAFVVRARMERAQFLLRHSMMTVGEVARALGYTDPALFSHQFRKHYGVPPSRILRSGVTARET